MPSQYKLLRVMSRQDFHIFELLWAPTPIFYICSWWIILSKCLIRNSLANFASCLLSYPHAPRRRLSPCFPMPSLLSSSSKIPLSLLSSRLSRPSPQHLLVHHVLLAKGSSASDTSSPPPPWEPALPGACSSVSTHFLYEDTFLLSILDNCIILHKLRLQ